MDDAHADALDRVRRALDRVADDEPWLAPRLRGDDPMWIAPLTWRVVDDTTKLVRISWVDGIPHGTCDAALFDAAMHVLRAAPLLVERSDMRNIMGDLAVICDPARKVHEARRLVRTVNQYLVMTENDHAHARHCAHPRC